MVHGPPGAGLLARGPRPDADLWAEEAGNVEDGLPEPGQVSAARWTGTVRRFRCTFEVARTRRAAWTGGR